MLTNFIYKHNHAVIRFTDLFCLNVKEDNNHVSRIHLAAVQKQIYRLGWLARELMLLEHSDKTSVRRTMLIDQIQSSLTTLSNYDTQNVRQSLSLLERRGLRLNNISNVQVFDPKVKENKTKITGSEQYCRNNPLKNYYLEHFQLMEL